jgi:DNA end-binding protein Ku
MAPRASWKGFLNLSLVSVPVKAYSSSNSGSQLRLNQLHAECNSRIKQKLTCPVCGDIERSEIVKGYEYAKDQYVVVDLDELEKLRAEDDGKAIKIDTFVQPDAVDPIQFSETNYFLLPDGAAGQKPFALLHRALVEKDLHCVANVVLHSKEQLVLIRPMDELLCMTTLKYAHQVKATSSFDDERVETVVADAEYALAATLIDETTSDDFDLSQYKDQYTEKLTQLIEAKVSGQEVVEAPSLETPNVINLMDALKASVEKAQESGDAGAAKSPTTKKPAARKTAKKKAPSKSKKALVETLAGSGKQKKAAKRKSKTG